MRLVTLRPSLMVVFSSFTIKAIRGRDVMLQGCNSQRKGGKREDHRWTHSSSLPGACPGTCLGGWVVEVTKDPLGRRPKERKEGKWSLC